MSEELTPIEPDEVQGELIGLQSLPERPDVVEWIQSQPANGIRPAHRHTGRRFLKKLANCPELAEYVWVAIRTGLSIRLVAWRCGVSPNTVAAARTAMTERGELEPVRRRIDRRLDEFAEEALEYAIEGTRFGRIHPGQILIPALAAYDKKSQRDAGMVVGTQRTLSEVTVADVEAARQLLDAQSVGSERKPLRQNELIDVDTVVDTVVDTGPVAPGGPEPAVPAPRPEAGGGIASPAAPAQVDGMGLKFSQPKEAP